MRKIAHGADLLLAFGVRFDDRVTGKVDKFCEGGTIVHIDIDSVRDQQEQAVPTCRWSATSNTPWAGWRKMVKERPIEKKFTAWHKQIAAWKAKAPSAIS